VFKIPIPKLSIWSLLVYLVFILTLIMIMPVVGDEAYFISWGQQLKAGVYDHPPFTSWVAWVFSFLPAPTLGLRLFSFCIGLIMTVCIYQVICQFLNKSQSLILSISWLILPFNFVVFSQFLNDTLVYFFSLLFLLCAYQGIQASKEKTTKSALIWSVLMGVSLGLGLLVKYLIGIYVIALTLTLLVTIKIV